MDITEFEDELQRIRCANGWRIILELDGIWHISVHDKESNRLLASTGSTGLSCIFKILNIPFDEPPWLATVCEHKNRLFPGSNICDDCGCFVKPPAADH